MLLHRFARQLPLFRLTPETMGLILFGLVILATVPFSIWPGNALELFVDSYLKMVIVFILMMNTLTTRKRLEQFIWLVVCCCGYHAARAAFDYARGVNLVEGGRVAGAVSGIFGNPNDLALNMVTFMPAALMVALTRRHPAWRRLTAAAIAALMLATVVFTKSRGGALGMGAMLSARACSSAARCARDSRSWRLWPSCWSCRSCPPRSGSGCRRLPTSSRTRRTTRDRARRGAS
jgi:hypothetical protein